MNSGKKKWRSRIFIVTAGVTLGYLARFALGVPEIEDRKPTRVFNEPLTESSIGDLPIIKVDDELELLLP